MSFRIKGLTEMLYQMVFRLGRTIKDLILMSFGTTPPSINWSALYDDMGNKKVGFSFIKDPRNKTLARLDS